MTQRDPSATRSDPRSYDYTHPGRKCDIVMKGGITSGVVYPHAICELARTYRFQSIGGTSAGAIAAAGAAASEYGREKEGFAKLAELPDRLGENLLSLFQPQDGTAGLFATLVAGLGQHRSGLRRFLRVLLTAFRNFWPLPTIATAPGLALGILAATSSTGFLRIWGIVCAILLVAAGAVAGLGFALYRSVTRDLPGNRFGLCSGFNQPHPSRPTPLTTWLADLLDDLAGKQPGEEKPLTFGDLWSGPATRHREIADSKHWLTLEMITTNLTTRQSHRIPWEAKVFFFDPTEFRELFPERVVRWMEEHPPPEPDQKSERQQSWLTREFMRPRLPLPAPEDLPVIVATRMSLSFPLLLSAIPLWAFDRTRSDWAIAREAWLARIRDDVEWDRLKSDPAALARAREELGTPAPEVCWFSDGGISSNFPIHFFDSPIPRWPTFGINLKDFHPDHPKDDKDESKNVWLAPDNHGGMLETWTPIPKQPGRAQLVGFFSSIARTMQNRVDNAQLRVPGFRDRIAHVNHTEREGGMNLKMDPRVILALAERGRWAAAKLVERFAEPPKSERALSWANHRWVRYRSTMAVLEEMLGKIIDGYTSKPDPGELGYEDLIVRDSKTPPNSYRWQRAAQRDFAAAKTARLVEYAEPQKDSSESFAENAPEPPPEARIVPRD